MTNYWDDKFSALAIPSATDLLLKSKYKNENPERAPRSYMENPLDLRTQLGYKDRRYSVTFDILKRIPNQLGIIAGIVQTRCNQISTFAVPHRENQGIGFRVTLKDKAASTTKGQLEFIKSAENFFRNCGQPNHNKYSNIERDSFKTFLIKFVKDSLVLDQSCMEIIPDKKGRPYEFLAVDASTIRIASPFFEDFAGKKQTFNNLIDPSNLNGEDAYTTLDPNAPFMDRPAYVQIVDGKVVNVYSRNELAFCTRNPRTDLQVQGYGQSEIEMMINVITAHLNAETYNSVFFKQGSNSKGLLNIKSDDMSPETLEAFRRLWRESTEGVNNFHRTPILNSAAGVEWISLQQSNKDMEFGHWVEYLTKLACAVYQIDPAELNFDMQGGVQQTPLFESSSEWKLKASRDKGLRPLLRFVSDSLNKHIMSRMDDDFIFEFIGLDEPTEMDKHNLRKEQASTYKTLNEVRVAEDLPPLPHGDIPMNPVYVQILTMREQQKQAQAQAAPTEGQQPEGGQPEASNVEDDSNTHIPQYGDTFYNK